MTFFHGTSEQRWVAIQREGVLWGIRNAPSRCTYLACREEEAATYGGVVLRVEYEPGGGIDNYCEGCWQLRVYTPIPLSAVTRVPQG